MKRRDFMLCSSAAAVVGALPVVAAKALRGSLFDDPQAWIGSRFRTASGATLALVEVEHVVGGPQSVQTRLQFRMLEGDPLAEGMHELSTDGRSEALFLQRGRAGPVACVNRLRALA